LQDKIAWLPLDRILVETDDSDLSIEPKMKKTEFSPDKHDLKQTINTA